MTPQLLWMLLNLINVSKMFRARGILWLGPEMGYSMVRSRDGVFYG